MRLFLLCAAILVVGAFTQDLEEENEPSLCEEHDNPNDYTHCIKKRETNCQNGRFCGTCNGNSCQTCTGNNCRTSCNGAACSQCPNGDCCDGQNCNVCAGRNCCSESSCNNCVNTCNTGCSTPACKSGCFQACQGNSCCDKKDCFSSCRNQCFGDHCYESCFKGCSCPQNCSNPLPGLISPNITIPGQYPPQEANHTIVVVNKPDNKNPVNITTIVNLKNYINNKNVIHTPVNITNINHNHINETRSPIPKPENIANDKCCIVIYPVHCYDIAEHPYKKCIQKRAKKCGEMCTSVVVHVVHVPGKDREVPVPYPIPVPGPVQVVRQPQPVPVPVVQRYPVYVQGGGTQCGASGGCGYRQICHYINRYPWVSCSNYGAQNCGSCYVCGGQYNPGHCSQQVGCAGLCRGGIVNFGNSWQSDILRYAPQFSTQPQGVPSQLPQQQPQPQPIEVPIPQQQQQQQQQPVDIQQQDYSMQQQLDLQQQGYPMQQPVDPQQQGHHFLMPQQFVPPPMDYQQQQFIVQPQYGMQQPMDGMHQQFLMQQIQQPIQQMQQPMQVHQPGGYAGQ